ncbi:hypothetical protein VMCG_07788 [Cytospora schulzeri]|uniref:Uncharacterized protein n=1 Tax=Cytospora schulzeri TaxID=448051 RepID=A0A423VZZ0_9PEZI|nr:hypothetical protein VMCG_07788 [Valsa malicola]
MTDNRMELTHSMAMDCDETIDLDIATADHTPALVGSSPEYYQLRSGRKIFKSAGNSASQKPGVQGKLKKQGRGVRKKKKREHRKATTATEGKRQQLMQDAIANGSCLFNEAEHKGNPVSTVEHQPEQLQQLTEELVLQALFDQTPGLTFPSHPNSNPLSSEEMNDLVKALQDYQTTLARKGNAIQSPDVGKLVKTFTHDVLSLLSEVKQCPNRFPSGEEVWDSMSHSLKVKGSRGWLRGTVMQKLDEICGVGEAKNLRKAHAFNRAIVVPGRNHQLNLAITYARQQLGDPHYGHSATLRSLVRHFEAARTRYLTSINHAERAMPYAHDDVDMADFSGGTPPLQLKRKHTDSSDEGSGALGDSGGEADVEDNIQVEGELLLGRDRALIRALDLWMELSKQGERRDSVDVDMMSALELVDGI